MWALVPVQFSLHGKVRDDSDLEGKPEATRGVTKPTYDFAELQSNFHIQGGLTEPVEVAMRVLIDEKGNVVQVDVENDAQYSVVSAAVEAVKKTHFEPGTQNGDPIAVWTTITIKASPKKSTETGE
jgi:TonB family protein